jgi:hypothetical protein
LLAEKWPEPLYPTDKTQKGFGLIRKLILPGKHIYSSPLCISEVRKRIEEGNMEEFVMASIDKEGEVNIHASAKDLIGGVGLFEVGKNILIQQQTMIDYE